KAAAKNAKSLESYRVAVVDAAEANDIWAGHGLAKFLLGDYIAINSQIDLIKILTIGVTQLSKRYQSLPSQAAGVSGSFFESVRTNAERDAARTRATWAQVTRQMSADFQALAQVSGPAFSGIARDIGILIVNLDAASKEAEKFGGSMGVASALFATNASAAERWAATVRSATTLAAGAMDVWAQSTDQGSKSLNALGGALAGAKAGAAFGPWGALVGAATGAMIGWVRSLNHGRDAVRAFALDHGGFDALHNQLSKLGTEGEAMWVKLTQGIKKGDLAAAQKQFGIIEQALSDLDAKTKHSLEEATRIADEAFEK